MAHRDIAVFVKSRRKHRAPVLLKILLHVRPPAEKGHAKWRFGNDHNISSLLKLLSPIVKHICNRLLHGDLLSPPGVTFQFINIPDDDPLVCGTK